MTRYLVRRLLLAIPTLFGIVVLVFLLLHLAPGSPASAGGSPEAGRRVSAAAREEMRGHLIQTEQDSERYLGHDHVAQSAMR